MRRTQLSRTVPLQPGTKPLSRSSRLQSVPWSRAVPLEGAGKGKSAPRQKDTGPSRKVRLAVLARDGYRCVCCGRSVRGQRYSLQHRKRRSQGGTNDMSNLITVLGDGTTGCHARIDSRKDPRDEARGYTVRSWQDPREVGVMVFSEHGSGVTAWPTDAGTYVFEAPAGAVA